MVHKPSWTAHEGSQTWWKFSTKYHALTKSPGLTNSTLNCEMLPVQFIHFQYASLSNHKKFTHKIYYPYGRVHSGGLSGTLCN